MIGGTSQLGSEKNAYYVSDHTVLKKKPSEREYVLVY